MDFYACTSLDLNADDTRLTSASSLKGPDKVLWEKAHAQDRLVKHLATHNYIQCVNTPCLFINKENGVTFTLDVDDFLTNTSSAARWITYSAFFVNYMRSPQISLLR